MLLIKQLKKWYKKICLGAPSTAESIIQSIDLKDKIIVITGTNTGLGAESARVLSARGAYIIGLSREPCRHISLFIPCDLTAPEQIRRAIITIIKLDKKIDAIICNAGVMALPTFQQVYGHEKQFFINHVAHFILVSELLPFLKENARIIAVASEGYRLALTQDIAFDNINNAHNYQAWRSYGQSKLANILFIKALARRFEGSQQVAIAVHPGIVNTRLSRYLPLWQQKLLSVLVWLGIKNVKQGAVTQVFAAVHPAALSMNGVYLSNCQIKPLAKGVSENVKASEQLWQISMDIKQKIMADLSVLSEE